MAKAKLKSALDRYKGRDYQLEKQKKLRKEAEKQKRATGILPTEDPKKGKKAKRSKREEGENDEEVPELIDVSKLEMNGKKKGNTKEKETKSESEAGDVSDKEDWEDEEESDDSGDDEGGEDGAETSNKGSKRQNGQHTKEGGEGEDDEDEEEEEEYSDIDIEDLDEDDLEAPDVIPYQRLTINNTAALTNAYKSIALPIKSLPFSEHLSITTLEPVEIKDVHDDLNRELAFYKQALEAARKGRELLLKEGVPFSRPLDYFAEMVKSDEHMGKIKKKLLEEAAAKKAAQEARKLRDLKKFGKQVQVAKLQEREKAKKETLEKINILKRKRQQGNNEFTDETDMFDVALEEAAKDDKKARKEKYGGPQSGPNHKRQKKNEKYGFGGKKRHSKSGDAISSGDLSSFSARAQKARGFGGAKGKRQRPGKSKRAAKR